MKQTIILIFLLTIISSVYAYYPAQNITIPAIFTVNDIPTAISANITIRMPNGVLAVSAPMTANGTGRFYYIYTFPNILGNYYIEVTFYNDSGVKGIAGESYEVVYNHTEDFSNISTQLQTQKSLIDDIWDWVQSEIFGNREYSTSIIGKSQVYNNVTFYTDLNYVPLKCEIDINGLVHNMSITDKIATYTYYINQSGDYTWQVNCT